LFSLEDPLETWFSTLQYDDLTVEDRLFGKPEKSFDDLGIALRGIKQVPALKTDLVITEKRKGADSVPLDLEEVIG
jgi:hypothetical protein